MVLTDSFQVKEIVVNPGANSPCKCTITVQSTGWWYGHRQSHPRKGTVTSAN